MLLSLPLFSDIDESMLPFWIQEKALVLGAFHNRIKEILTAATEY